METNLHFLIKQNRRGLEILFLQSTFIPQCEDNIQIEEMTLLPYIG